MADCDHHSLSHCLLSVDATDELHPTLSVNYTKFEVYFWFWGKKEKKPLIVVNSELCSQENCCNSHSQTNVLLLLQDSIPFKHIYTMCSLSPFFKTFFCFLHFISHWIAEELGGATCSKWASGGNWTLGHCSETHAWAYAPLSDPPTCPQCLHF